MHGIIFLQLRKFADHVAGSGAWEALLKEANLPLKTYSAVRAYSDDEVLALVGAAHRLLKLPVADILEQFGEFLAPDLLRLYGRLLESGWKTLDVVENTERLIHAAVRVGNPGARPPVLECIRSSADELQVIYSSERQLCCLAKGIIKGLAKHFQERVQVVDDACMLNGDPFCALLITRERGQDTNELPGELCETIVHTHDLPAPSVGVISNPASESLGAAEFQLGTSAEQLSAKFSEREHASRDGGVFGSRTSGSSVAGRTPGGSLASRGSGSSVARGSLADPPGSSGRSGPLGAAGSAGSAGGGQDGSDWLDQLTHLGEFRVVRKLGQGGMGVVMLAEDLRLGRQVALKVMQPRYASDEVMRQRFLREARAMAAIKSDYVVTVYEVGVASGLPFLAMELLQGESLESYRQRLGRVPIESILRFGRQAAQGLAAAHDQGVIHRDIKPSNLWIESPNSRLKILDFGLARAVHDSAQVSIAGKVIGTPAFMAPEQARGDAVDHRADLFSLGCVLYWLAANELPFRGVDLMSTLMALATHEPPPVSALSDEVPQAVSDLIMRMLRKNPAERLATGQEVVDLIRQLENGPGRT